MELQTEYTVSAIGFQLKSLVFSIFPILFYMKIVFKNVLSHHKKIQNPKWMKEKFMLTVETLHANDKGDSENVSLK